MLEQQAARAAGLLTERTRQTLWRARHGRTRHVEATEPGELLCLDTFYIGNLKGVGKVWQITACDAATSYGLAGLLPAHDAEAAATFLRTVVVPHFQRAGWPVQRVLTDGGPGVNTVSSLDSLGPYSITRSARSSREGGIVRPMALAVT